MHPGEQLREIRSKIGITPREVAVRSRIIADTEGNEDYAISNPYLTQIENGDAELSSIHKVFSLASIYGFSVPELLLLIGFDIHKVAIYHDRMPGPKTHLAHYQSLEDGRGIDLPIRFDPSWSLNKTHLLSRAVEAWGTIPLTFLRHFDVRHRLYGYVGLNDYTLDPIIKPGSFVVIDPELRKVREHATYRTETDRPIYFIDLRSEYACAWCEILGGKLFVIPHLLSGRKIREFAFPEAAEIIGQVTGVAMQIVQPLALLSDETSELSRRS